MFAQSRQTFTESFRCLGRRPHSLDITLWTPRPKADDPVLSFPQSVFSAYPHLGRSYHINYLILQDLSSFHPGRRVHITGCGEGWNELESAWMQSSPRKLAALCSPLSQEPQRPPHPSLSHSWHQRSCSTLGELKSLA